MRLPELLPGKGAPSSGSPALSGGTGASLALGRSFSGGQGFGNLWQLVRSSQSTAGQPLCSAWPQPQPCSPSPGCLAGQRWFPACCRGSCSGRAVQSLFQGVCVHGLTHPIRKGVQPRQPFPAALRPRLQPFGSGYWRGEGVMHPKAAQASSKPCRDAGEQGSKLSVLSHIYRRGGSPLHDGISRTPKKLMCSARCSC